MGQRDKATSLLVEGRRVLGAVSEDIVSAGIMKAWEMLNGVSTDEKTLRQLCKLFNVSNVNNFGEADIIHLAETVTILYIVATAEHENDMWGNPKYPPIYWKSP